MKKRLVLALLLLFALTLAGCAGEGARQDPWTWAQELKADGITAAPWHSGGEPAALSADETEALLSLLNGLSKDDFTENKGRSGGTPTYGVQIETPTETYHINESIAPGGALELQYGGTLWWIDSDALHAFIAEKAGG